MKGLIKFFLILGASIFFAVSLCAFLVSINLLPYETVNRYITLSMQNIGELNYAVIGGVIALLFFIISVVIFYASFKEKVIKREITFGNPLGEVKVSLSAISEFVRKLGDQIDEIKEVKPRVVIGRKGLEIYNKITLFSDSSIPEASDRVQTLVKRYVQDVLGIQEVNEVKVFVEKIVPRESAKEKSSDS